LLCCGLSIHCRLKPTTRDPLEVAKPDPEFCDFIVFGSQTKEKEMNRIIIQVDTDRVAYDGRDWTPVAGEHAWAIARMMKSRERLYKRKAAAHPDFAYNVARAAAEDFHGRIVEYQPIPPAKPGIFR
jgi:hypothetical protein